MGCSVRTVFALLFTAWSMNAATYYVVIAGLGGTPEYDQQFAKWANDLDRELQSDGRGARVETLAGAKATKEQIRGLFSRLDAEAKADDAVAVFLLGHGAFDGVEYKFNIPGPDLTAAELNALLNRLPPRRQLVVNMTSCSGASIAALAKKDRIVIAATKSGTEKNATVFARYWIDALRDPAADTDKNGAVSALEAFRYTERKTASYFENEKLLATEHAIFTDTGSANAVRDPKPENGQGLLAAAFPLIRPPLQNTAQVGAGKQTLLNKKEDLEAKIDRLKYQKAAMPEQEYKQQLTALLVDLARTQAEIDK